METRRLLREEITYSLAKEREVNILHQLGYFDQQSRFFSHLYGRREWMKAVIAHHLGLGSTDMCHIANMEDWFRGSFNVCIPVTIDNWKGRRQPGHRVILRFPLPYRVGEGFRPGNGDEKIKCEAGAYAWLQQNCPDVPIPRLYGFAMSTGETFTRIEHLPFLGRFFQSLRHRLLQWLRLPVPSPYIPHKSSISARLDSVNEAGYLLIECIEETQGTMLSNTWAEKQYDVGLRTNFFKSLSQILLSISRTPLPRIGSFIINKEGYLTLNNRPLSMELHELENEKIPTGLSRDYTYSTVESYVMDILGVHDSRLRYQPNAVNSGVDDIDVGEYDKLRKELLTAMNIEETELFRTSLSNEAGETPLRLSEVMEQAWATGTFWYTLALSSPTGLFSLFYDHVQPLLSNNGSEEIGEVMPFY
ncbi:uncharacterized protein N7459_005552 [Penicillium hispanicum]|uniref:uncharacterized protein n=1 Tax=Penicillium hispanicum TaxID=1080232 RepID=UPI002541D2E5|nr:uncharacterized protein N7459_005552 [Penicillium hispanicum]KAJ5579567.1 hypothetical protein N7459_005552 [Penicillium hispanicum]